MQWTYNNNNLKIDNGDHYYIGIVTKEQFPPIIADNYDTIVKKSLENFSDDVSSIKSTILDNKYIIDFKFNSRLINVSEKVEIPITKYDKDYRDYINERIQKLESDNKELKNKLVELSTIILKIESEKDSEYSDSDEEESNY